MGQGRARRGRVGPLVQWQIAGLHAGPVAAVAMEVLTGSHNQMLNMTCVGAVCMCIAHKHV